MNDKAMEQTEQYFLTSLQWKSNVLLPWQQAVIQTATAYRSEGEQAAERETFEQACKAVCWKCANGEKMTNGLHFPGTSPWSWRECPANPIRAAFPHLAPSKEK